MLPIAWKIRLNRRIVKIRKNESIITPQQQKILSAIPQVLFHAQENLLDQPKHYRSIFKFRERIKILGNNV